MNIQAEQEYQRQIIALRKKLKVVRDQARNKIWKRDAKKIRDLKTKLELLQQAAEELLDNRGSHSEHWDIQGTHGVNCPACMRERPYAIILRKTIEETRK